MNKLQEHLDEYHKRIDNMNVTTLPDMMRKLGTIIQWANQDLSERLTPKPPPDGMFAVYDTETLTWIVLSSIKCPNIDDIVEWLKSSNQPLTDFVAVTNTDGHLEPYTIEVFQKEIVK